MSADMDAKATDYEEWFLKVLLNLVGPDLPFESGHRAILDVDYDFIRCCWDKGNMTQYDAAREYIKKWNENK